MFTKRYGGIAVGLDVDLSKLFAQVPKLLFGKQDQFASLDDCVQERATNMTKEDSDYGTLFLP